MFKMVNIYKIFTDLTHGTIQTVLNFVTYNNDNNYSFKLPFMNVRSGRHMWHFTDYIAYISNNIHLYYVYATFVLFYTIFAIYFDSSRMVLGIESSNRHTPYIHVKGVLCTVYRVHCIMYV